MTGCPKAAIETLADKGDLRFHGEVSPIFAFIFFMRLRTWTFTVLSHMFNS